MNGFLWQTADELIEKSALLIKSKNSQERLREKAVASSRKFNINVFTDAYDRLLGKMTNER